MSSGRNIMCERTLTSLLVMDNTMTITIAVDSQCIGLNVVLFTITKLANSEMNAKEVSESQRLKSKKSSPLKSPTKIFNWKWKHKTNGRKMRAINQNWRSKKSYQSSQQKRCQASNRWLNGNGTDTMLDRQKSSKPKEAHIPPTSGERNLSLLLAKIAFPQFQWHRFPSWYYWQDRLHQLRKCHLRTKGL